jgi:succinate dehydrogenase hydrophobic anchor subunit
MLDTIITGLLLLFGVVCMIFVVLIYRKGHMAAIPVLLILAFLGLFSSANWVRGFFKTVVIHTIQGYGKIIEDFQGTLEQQTQQLLQLQGQLSQSQAEIRAAQEKAGTLQGELAQSQAEIRAAQEKVGTIRGELTQNQGAIRAAQDKLTEQQQELADVNRLLKTIVGASRTEAFYPDQRPVRMIVLEHEPRKSSVYVLLHHVPIAQSIQLQWHLFSQPRLVFRARKSLNFCMGGRSITAIRETPYGDVCSRPRREPPILRDHIKGRESLCRREACYFHFSAR